MIQFTGRAILLDVEGTTSSVRFVNEVLFNYARQMLDSYLRSHWDTDEQVRRESRSPAMRGPSRLLLGRAAKRGNKLASDSRSRCFG